MQVTHVLLKTTVIVQIMDSLTGNFRTDFTGRGELADRQQKLGQMLSRLRKVGGEWGYCSSGCCICCCCCSCGYDAASGPVPSLGHPCRLTSSQTCSMTQSSPQISEEFNVAVVVTNMVSDGSFP